MLAALSGAAAEAPTGFPTGRIVEHVECAASPGQSYALYLPSAYPAERRWPVLYLFDPRQRGPEAAERFREAAEAFGYILASSNNSRSDGPAQVNVDAMKAMWKDTLQRFMVDGRRLYAGGLSGGARAACVMARGLPESVVGVIGCSGGFPEDWPPSKEAHFAFYGLAGNRDFNYPELQDLDRTLQGLGIAHRVVVFDGEHEWPPPEECAGAVEWMELRAMRDGLRPVDRALVEKLFQSGLARARAQEAAGAVIETERRFSGLASDFENLLDVSGARSRAEQIRASGGYEKARKLRERLEKRDREYLEKAHKVIGTALGPSGQMPLGRILKELQIEELQDEVRRFGRSEEGLASARLLQTLLTQTGFYVPRLLRERKQPARAALSFEVAVAIRPEDPYLWYNLACARALAGESGAAIDALEKACAAGFHDPVQLQQDADLAPLRAEPRYLRLLQQLGASSPETIHR
jgi:predicted esterase